MELNSDISIQDENVTEPLVFEDDDGCAINQGSLKFDLVVLDPANTEKKIQVR